jgi:hypothetical protein
MLAWIGLIEKYAISQAVARNDYGRFASAFQTIKSKPSALATAAAS